MNARQLPANIDAEVSVLTTCMTDSSGKAVEKAVEILKAEHFASPAHRRIFEAICELHITDVSVDLLTVTRHMERHHQLEDLTKPWRPDQDRESAGREFLASFTEDVPVITRLPHHARLIVDSWGKREIIKEFTPAMQGAWNGVAPDEVLKAVETAVMALHGRLHHEGGSQVVSALQAAQSAQERVQQGVNQAGAVPPPYAFLDSLMPGRLYVLGGYAKDGKTDVGVEALKRACMASVPTGFVSIEMPEAYLTDRLISTFGVPYGPLTKGVVSSENRDSWKNAVGTIGLWPYEIYDNPAADVSEIFRFQKMGRFKFLIVDHLHQIAYEDAYNPRLKLSANVKSLATLARQHQIPVLLLAQLHRPPNSDGFPKPTMQSFKETGTIEAVAAALWAIYRKRDPETGERLPDSSFMVLADRYGPDSVNRLLFEGRYQRFTEVDWRSNA